MCAIFALLCLYCHGVECNLFTCKSYCNIFQFQDEDFVADKDDSGSPSDDSEEGSDASISDGEKEVTKLLLTVSVRKLT